MGNKIGTGEEADARTTSRAVRIEGGPEAELNCLVTPLDESREAKSKPCKGADHSCGCRHEYSKTPGVGIPNGSAFLDDDPAETPRTWSRRIELQKLHQQRRLYADRWRQTGNVVPNSPGRLDYVKDIEAYLDVDEVLATKGRDRSPASASTSKGSSLTSQSVWSSLSQEADAIVIEEVIENERAPPCFSCCCTSVVLALLLLLGVVLGGAISFASSTIVADRGCLEQATAKHGVSWLHAQMSCYSSSTPLRPRKENADEKDTVDVVIQNMNYLRPQVGSYVMVERTAYTQKHAGKLIGEICKITEDRMDHDPRPYQIDLAPGVWFAEADVQMAKLREIMAMHVRKQNNLSHFRLHRSSSHSTLLNSSSFAKP